MLNTCLLNDCIKAITLAIVMLFWISDWLQYMLLYTSRFRIHKSYIYLRKKAMIVKSLNTWRTYAFSVWPYVINWREKLGLKSRSSTNTHYERQTHVKRIVVAATNAAGYHGFSQRRNWSPARMTSPHPCNCSSSWLVSWA